LFLHLLQGARLIAFPRVDGGKKELLRSGGMGALVDLEEGDSVQRGRQRGKGRSVESSSPGVPSPDATSVDPDLEQDENDVTSLDQHAARKAQLAAEDRVVLRLRVQGFKGGEYDQFEAKLVR
jgi:hypothetical protein